MTEHETDRATPTAVQLYTLRGLSETVPELIRRVGAVDDAGYDGVEFAGLGDSDPGDVADALDETGLSAAAAHVGLDDLEDDPDAVADTYDRLDCDTVVVPHLGPPRFDGADAVEETARRLSAVAARLDERGVTLAYHNHDHEFGELGDRTAFDALVEATDDRVRFEVDAGWVLAGGLDPASLLARLSDRVELVHVKDMNVNGDDHSFAEVGEGDVDLEAVATAARDAAAEYLIYEHDDPPDPVASLETGATVLSTLAGSNVR